ncbi:lipid A deacylase LpxR family protein [Photobacterium sp. TY1-4]|uniref:lipid A deacylase LpxR family protein n=1 Tax=Photobacterium sp. TY1-4 TaxID=2899122 RepID=UPI0021C0925D|nr:lipid A deacylase LpxR family protein [Photobacterium sp. TY1-4]UXI04044.1 lipid A deacylase LpxR family protein [Photobacterium sp. TY1-4]
MKRVWLGFITHLLFLSPVAGADNSGLWSLALDNDGALGTDKNYTHGFFATYHAPAAVTFQSLLPAGLSNAADTLLSSEQSLKGASLRFGTQIWTPATLDSTIPLAGERPYAGLLFIETALYQFSVTQTQSFQVMLGTLGPHARAEQGQTLIHELIGSDKPMGWDYQVDNPLVLNLTYQANHRILSGDLSQSTASTSDAQAPSSPPTNIRYDLSYTGRLTAGNYQTEFAVGSIARLGATLHTPSGSHGFIPGHVFNPGMATNAGPARFLFIGLEGRYQLTDQTIEGKRLNQDIPIPPTTLEPWQASLLFGGAYLQPDWGAVASITINTPDFKEDLQSSYAWGSLMVFWRP